MSNRHPSRFAKALRPTDTAARSTHARAATRLSYVRALAIVPALLLLAGCLSIGGDKNVVIYAPAMVVAPQADWPAVTWPLVVVRPLASDALDSARIAVRPEPGTLQVYQGAVWSDAAPDLLQTALVHAFEDSGKIVSVGRQSSGLRADFALMLDMRRFEAVYEQAGQPPSALVELQAKLLAYPGSRVLAARTFRVAVPAADAQVPAVVAAFDAAGSQVVTQIVGWTLATGQANAQRVGPAR